MLFLFSSYIYSSPLYYHSPFLVSAGVSDLLYPGLASSLHLRLHLVPAFVPLFSMIPHRQAFSRSLRAISLTDQIWKSTLQSSAMLRCGMSSPMFVHLCQTAFNPRFPHPCHSSLWCNSCQHMYELCADHIIRRVLEPCTPMCILSSCQHIYIFVILSCRSHQVRLEYMNTATQYHAIAILTWLPQGMCYIIGGQWRQTFLHRSGSCGKIKIWRIVYKDW